MILSLQARSKYFEPFMLQSISVQPDNVHLRNLLAEHYQHTRQFGKARDVFVQASLKQRWMPVIVVRKFARPLTSRRGHLPLSPFEANARVTPIAAITYRCLRGSTYWNRAWLVEMRIVNVFQKKKKIQSISSKITKSMN